MKFIVRVERITDWGETTSTEVGKIDRPNQSLKPRSVGLSLENGKRLLHGLQRAVIRAQTDEFCALRRVCQRCHRWLAGRGTSPLCPTRFAHYSDRVLSPLLDRVHSGLGAVSAAVTAGTLRIDDDLHLTALPAAEEDLEVEKLRSALDRRIGEAQLPEVILAVDPQVRFSWVMLGREPKSADELLMVYAGVLAHRTVLSAAETARMIPQLSATAVRQAMREGHISCE